MRSQCKGMMVLSVIGLVSCAGFITPAPSAVELYDISAYRAAEENLPRSSGDLAVPFYPEPAILDLRPETEAAPVPASLGAEIWGTAPASPRDAPVIRFALPEVPAEQSVKTVAPAKKSPVQSAAKPAAQNKAASPGQGTAAQNKASMPIAVVDPAPVKSSGGDAVRNVREIYARIGDEVEIGLEGSGFVFLGFPEKTQADGMSFKSKESRDGKTYFKFKAFTRGTYDLGFLRQDNASGKTARESVRVHVVSDSDFAAAVERQVLAPPSDTADDTADYAYAERLAGLGKYDSALAEYMKGYREGDSLTNERIASLYASMGDEEAAEKYYRKNLSAAGIYSEAAVLGLVRIALDRKDSDAFFSNLKQFLAIKELNIEATLLLAARFQKEKGEIGVCLELLGEYVKRYPQGEHRDEADCLLAQVLEVESPFRDIPRARALYQEVLRLYPESPYAGPARERLRYIEQHFYYVR